VLTYDTSINLLNYLCSLIESDQYTPTAAPKYSGDFCATVHLPFTLPLPRSYLTYTGPVKRSKKEAKRAVAFLAVKTLHSFSVFDDYLLPASNSRDPDAENADRTDTEGVQDDPHTMNVLVRDPWTVAGNMWVHPVYLDGSRTAAVITGTRLPSLELRCEGHHIRMGNGTLLVWDENDEDIQRELLETYTKLGISYCNTGRQITSPLTCFLVPLTDGDQPDFRAIKALVDNPYGSSDWTNISEADYDRLMIINSHKIGRPFILRRIRYDLTPMSTPPSGSREEFLTYREYFLDNYKRKTRNLKPPFIPNDGPLLEGCPLPRRAEGAYELKAPYTDVKHSVSDGVMAPQGCCRWIAMSDNIYLTFHVFPQLCHRITDIYRARRARIELSLPNITDDLLVEALTLPPAEVGWNNQRLETLGDSVLKLGTTVHLYNKFPYRHEGQLSTLRQHSICNRTLRARAEEVGLERFLSCEKQNLSVWRYVTPERSGPFPIRYTKQQFPRRNLQDCMESILGAAFLTGGIPSALQAGEALGMAMGGVLPWPLRYSRDPQPTVIPPFFADLQEALGYEFHQSGLLIEAVAHPSFASSVGSSSYQRLEFLGDGKALGSIPPNH
jgi:endoribonuclease Dicer